MTERNSVSSRCSRSRHRKYSGKSLVKLIFKHYPEWESFSPNAADYAPSTSEMTMCNICFNWFLDRNQLHVHIAVNHRPKRADLDCYKKSNQTLENSTRVRDTDLLFTELLSDTNTTLGDSAEASPSSDPVNLTSLELGLQLIQTIKCDPALHLPIVRAPSTTSTATLALALALSQTIVGDPALLQVVVSTSITNSVLGVGLSVIQTVISEPVHVTLLQKVPSPSETVAGAIALAVGLAQTIRKNCDPAFQQKLTRASPSARKRGIGIALGLAQIMIREPSVAQTVVSDPALLQFVVTTPKILAIRSAQPSRSGGISPPEMVLIGQALGVLPSTYWMKSQKIISTKYPECLIVTARDLGLSVAQTVIREPALLLIIREAPGGTSATLLGLALELSQTLVSGSALSLGGPSGTQTETDTMIGMGLAVAKMVIRTSAAQIIRRVVQSTAAGAVALAVALHQTIASDPGFEQTLARPNKASKRGLALGLALAQAIVREPGAAADLASDPALSEPVLISHGNRVITSSSGSIITGLYGATRNSSSVITPNSVNTPHGLDEPLNEYLLQNIKLEHFNSF